MMTNAIFAMSLLVACGRVIDTPGAATGPTSSAAGQIVAYVVDPDTHAASLLGESLRGSRRAREDLARHYRSQGFGTMARLFDPREYQAVLKSWGCPDTGDSAIDREADAIANLRNEGRYSIAANTARLDLARYPGSCQLQVEWAKAVLLQDLQTKNTDDVALERAIRTLVTGATEVATVPTDSIGPAQTLHDVSRIFRARGDSIDALRCLELAQESLTEEMKRDPPPLLEDALHKLERRIKRDAAALREHVR